MAKNNYGKNVTLATTTISWSHLHKPDTKFGNPGNYNVSIEVTPEIEQQLKDAISASGFGKVNGINGISKDKTVRDGGTGEERTGCTVLKVKTNCKDGDSGSYGKIYDATPALTEAVPFGGDKVRLSVTPCLVERDGKVSFYLNGCQIIEKFEKDGDGASSTGGFGAVDGGFDGSNYEAPKAPVSAGAEDAVEEDNSDLPF